jgi:hypothetical protein
MRPTLVRWCERTEAVRPPPTRFPANLKINYLRILLDDALLSWYLYTRNLKVQYSERIISLSTRKIFAERVIPFKNSIVSCSTCSHVDSVFGSR